jgi:MFS family permease
MSAGPPHPDTPARPLSGEEFETTLGATDLWAAIPARAIRAQRLVQQEGMLFSAFTQLTGGAILTGFALALGAGPAAVGLLTSLPLFARLSQLYISWRIERAGHWPRSALLGAVIGRLTIALAILAAFLPVSDGVRLALLVAAMTVSAIGTATFELAFLTWMAELVPSRIRNAFLAHRSRTMGVFGLAMALAAAALLDWWHRDHPGSLTGFATVFAIALALGAASLVVISRIPHPRRVQTRLREEVRLRDAMAKPARDRDFRPLLHFGMAFGIGIGLLSPHLTVYLLQDLGLSFMAVTGLAAASTLASAVTNPFWGRLGDHFGTKTVVYAGALLLCTNPLMMLGVPALGVGIVITMHVISGVASGAFTSPMNSLILSMAKPEVRASYLAAFVASYATGQAVGAMLGGGVLRAAGAAGLSSGESFAVLFTLAALVRLGGSQLLGYVREAGAAPVGHMIRVVARARSMSTAFPIDPLLRVGSLHLARVADFIARDR